MLPYARPFHRGQFAGRLATYPYLHLLQRRQNEDAFRQANPQGFAHDLGAQDVFLDNFGIVAKEQLWGQPWGKAYESIIGQLVRRWALARRLVVQKSPWWGQYFNSRRKAKAGEPRSLLRLLPEDLGSMSAAERALPDGQRADRTVLDGRSLQRREQGTLFDQREDNDVSERLIWPPGEHDQWCAPIDGAPAWGPAEWENLFDRKERPAWHPRQEWRPGTHGFGVILPPDKTKAIDQVLVLPPSCSTPDLPAHVGFRTRQDVSTYAAVLKDRDQGPLRTCVAHAVVMALEVALGRYPRNRRRPRLSRTWMHLASGYEVNAGRTLSAAVDVVTQAGLPCEEDVLPYQGLLNGHIKRRDVIERADVLASQRRMARHRVVAARLDTRDVADVKAHLAAGWVVVVSTRITKGVMAQLDNPFIVQHGLLLTPLLGDEPSDSGHAWCLVGYDHVDGSLHWKYQGRFIALNSWGPACGSTSGFLPGVMTLPFSFVRSEGIEAFAIRIETD